MKKIAAAILLLCLFLNISGYHLLYLFRRQELKGFMKEYLSEHPDSKDITVLRFSLNDKAALQELEWENSHEFWYHGEIFDLVETKTEDHQLVIRCINDKNESKLVHLQEKINNETQGNAPSKNRDASLIHLVQTAFIGSDFTENESYSSRTGFVIQDDFYTSSLYYTVLTPPPQVI